SGTLEPSLRKTTTSIMLVYSIYTIAGMILLYLLGMPLYESIGMSFTALSTGGFTLSDNFYTSNMQLVVISALMILGSISFIAHNKLIRMKFKEFLFTYEKNIFLVIIAASAGLGLIVLSDAKIVVFQLISSFTTTGYSIASIPSLPQLLILLMMAGMIIGGGVASTSGGIKVFRLYSLVKSIPWMVKRLASPAGSVIPLNIRKKEMPEGNLVIIEIFFVTYIFLLVIGTVILMLLGYTFFDSSFHMTSALGTVGLQTMELASMHWLGKLVLMASMLLGRLEIFPLLVLIRNIIKG
ncbi:MAG: hypothetical protein KKE20_04075, partial [Nanoarchaeota archaeon]|nr:hypothetical protein [Nanoarchaeota archaeon]